MKTKIVMERERALEIVKKHYSPDGVDDTLSRALETLIPELTESEDERIREELIGGLMWQRDNLNANGRHDDNLILPGFTMRVGDLLAYLEKQKENSKSADSISSDCASGAKCENRWHKTANSLPDSGRDVLAKDALGNYLLASFDGAQWFVSVYDGEDHPVLHTPPILEWCEIPSEKLKEPKPELVQQPPITYTYNSNASRDERLKAALLALLNSDLLKVKEGGYFTKQDLIEWVETIPTDKPAEWSEEDEDMLNSCISSIEEAKENRYTCKETDGDTSYDHEITWLKSLLRPQPKAELTLFDENIINAAVAFVEQNDHFNCWGGIDKHTVIKALRSLKPHWKPSEEQMDALRITLEYMPDTFKPRCTLVTLQDDLKKQM